MGNWPSPAMRPRGEVVVEGSVIAWDCTLESGLAKGEGIAISDGRKSEWQNAKCTMQNAKF